MWDYKLAFVFLDLDYFSTVQVLVHRPTKTSMINSSLDKVLSHGVIFFI